MSTARDGAALQCRRVGESALLLELSGETSVRAWNAWLRTEHEQGRLAVIDIVPGSRTVLLDGLGDPAAIAGWLRNVEPPEPDLVAMQEVELDIRWDGADLDEVAEQWSLDRSEVIEALLDCRLEVAFSGFAPGFAYLSGLPAGRTVSRRSSPRTSVPAGSLGLAGPYAGIYPRASPGGWQLVGSTDAVLFDADRDPPALLGPGTVVRLVTAGTS